MDNFTDFFNFSAETDDTYSHPIPAHPVWGDHFMLLCLLLVVCLPVFKQCENNIGADSILFSQIILPAYTTLATGHFGVLLSLASLYACWLTHRTCEGNYAHTRGICPLIPEDMYLHIAPTAQYITSMADDLNSFWYNLLMPVFLHMQYIPWLGGGYGLLCKADAPPVSMPDQHSKLFQEPNSEYSMSQLEQRSSLWLLVLGIQWGLMLAANKLWHTLIIDCIGNLKRKKEQHAQEDATNPKGLAGKKVPIRVMFLMYHFSHHLFIFAIVNMVVVNGWISVNGLGLDWECYSLWMLWLFAVVNITAIVKYTLNVGENVSDSLLDTALTVAPVLGNDLMLMKEFVFAAVCFTNANTISLYTSWFANMAGVLTIFLSLDLFYEMYMDEIVLESFIRSHWPIVLAEEKDGISMFKGCCALTPDWKYKQWLNQTSVAKQIQTSKQNIPQAMIEVMYGLVFGFEGFVLVALALSVSKVIIITTYRLALLSDILALSERGMANAPYLLQRYWNMNGISGVPPRSCIVMMTAAKKEEASKTLCAGLHSSVGMFVESHALHVSFTTDTAWTILLQDTSLPIQEIIFGKPFETDHWDHEDVLAIPSNRFESFDDNFTQLLSSLIFNNKQIPEVKVYRWIVGEEIQGIIGDWLQKQSEVFRKQIQDTINAEIQVELGMIKQEEIDAKIKTKMGEKKAHDEATRQHAEAAGEELLPQTSFFKRIFGGGATPPATQQPLLTNTKVATDEKSLSFYKWKVANNMVREDLKESIGQSKQIQDKKARLEKECFIWDAKECMIWWSFTAVPLTPTRSS